MNASAGTLTLDFIANTQSLDKAMADMQRRALEYAKSIESDFARSLSIKPVVDDSALTALNKHLDLKQKHFKEVQRSFDSHPLTPKVNTASIDQAINKVQVLQERLGELTQRGSIGVRISSPTEETQQDNNQSSGGAKIAAEMEAGMAKVAQSMNTKIEQAFQASLKGITTTATAPLRAILTGMFEGVGHNVASVFSRGAIAAFQRDSGISLKNTGSRAGGYAGRVINELHGREGGSSGRKGFARPPVKPKGGGAAPPPDETQILHNQLQEISKALKQASSGLNRFDGGATKAAGEAMRLASALVKLYGTLQGVQKATNKANNPKDRQGRQGQASGGTGQRDEGKGKSSLQTITPKGFLRGDKADLTPEIAKRQVEAVRSRLQKRLDDLRQIPGGASSKQIGVLMNALATVQTRIANDIADPSVPENVRRSLGQLRRVNSKLAQTRRDLGSEAARVGFINAQGAKGRGGLGFGGKALGAGVGASVLGAGSAFAAPGPGVGLGFVGALPFDPTLGLAALGIGGSLAAARFAPKLLRRAGLNRTASVLETDVGGLATSAVSGVFRSLQGNVGGAVKGAAKGAAKALKQGVDSISAAVSSIVPPRPTTGTLGAGERFFRGLEAMFYRSPLFRGNVPPTQRRSLTSEATGFLFSGAALAAPGASLGLLAAPLLTALTPLLTTIGLVGNALAPLVGTIATTLKQTDPIRARLEYVSGGASGAGKNRDYVQGIAEKYNIATLPSLDQFSKLAAATKGTRLEGDGLKSLFEGIATAAKGLSLSTEDLNLVMYAFTQIASKGKLSAEEVRLQLAEKFPGIINILSKSLNMTVPEFNKVLEQGKLISEEVLPKLGEALQREYGDAAARASGNFLSALTKVDNAIFRLKDSVSQTLAPIFATITSTFGDAINVFAQNAQRLVPIFSVIVVGAAAQFFVGLTTILEGSGVLAKMQGFLIPMFGRLFATLTPFAVGIFADFLDDMFGAKTSVMDNMMKGVYNMVLTTILAFDDLRKNVSGLFEGMPSSDKNPFSGLGKVFRDIGSGLQSVKKFIAGTPVEFTALFLILAQTYVLLEKGLALVMARFGVTVGQLAMSFGRAVISGKVFNSVLNTLSAGLNKAQLVATAATTALILFFAKADFSNELGSAFDKLGDRMAAASAKIRSASGRTGNDLAKFSSSFQEIESKGFDFTIGFGETRIKTDDITKFIRQRARDMAELYKKTGLLSESGYKNQLEEINIRFVTIGEKQFIDNLEKLAQRAKELKGDIDLSGLISGAFNTNEFGKYLSDLKKYDEEIKKQQLRRVDILASPKANSPTGVAEVARIDEQIKKLLEQRNKVKEPLEKLKEGILEEADVFKTALELVNNSNLPEKYKQLAREQLQPSIDLAEQAKKKMEELGLIDLSPLAEQFTEVTKRIEKLDKALEKAQNNQKLQSLVAQTEIQASLERGEITPEQAQRRSNEEELRSLESNERTLADYINRRQSQLRDLYAIPSPNEQQKETIEKAEKDLQSKELELRQAQLSIKQKSNELKRQLVDLGKAIEDYYRGIQRTAADIALSVRESTNTIALTNAKNKLKTAILGFQDNFVSQFVDSLVGILDALNEPIQQALDAQRQIQQNSNQYQDTIRQGQETAKQLPAVVGGESAINTTPYTIYSGRKTNTSASQVAEHHGNGSYSEKTFNGKKERFLGDRLVKDIVLAQNGNQAVPVPSPVAGIARLVDKSESGGYGNLVEILNTQGQLIARLAHLESFAPSLRSGSQVAYGQAVGIQGSTGHSTGTHLHVELPPKVFEQYFNDLRRGSFTTASTTTIPTTSSAQSLSTINLAEIARARGLQSLAVQNVRSGAMLGYNATTAPASPASTIKVIVADLLLDALSSGQLDLNQQLRFKSSEIAQGDTFKAGQSISVTEALTQMLKASNNSATNILINALGGTGKVTAAAQSKGYKATEINNLLSVPGAQGFKNTSTAQDLTQAMRSILLSSSPGADGVRAALRNNQYKFGYSGETGGKIGFNSRVLGNVGIANIGGQDYIITSFANVGGKTPKNKGTIKGASEDVVNRLSETVPRQADATRKATSIDRASAGMTRLLHIIAKGESEFRAGAVNTDVPAAKSPRGAFQFTPGTRARAIERTGSDPWAGNIEEQAAVTKEWIRIIHPKAYNAANQGDLNTAIRLLRNEFTSLPGAKEDRKWKGPEGQALLQQYVSGNFTPKFSVGESNVTTQQVPAVYSSTTDADQQQNLAHGYSQANQNLLRQNQSVIDRYKASSALSQTNTNLQIEQAFRQLQQGYRDQKSRVLGFVRRDEDNGAELGISTPGKQYDINQRNTIRKYDEFYRELFGEKERLLGTMGATRSSINSIKQELASGNLDAAQTVIYKKSLAELEKALQGTVADLLKTDSLLQKQPEALARALEDNKGKYLQDATKLAAEFRDQSKGQALELTRGMAARAEAYQKRNPYDMSMGDPLLYNYQANVAEQALNFEKTKREYEELGRSGQRSPEQVKSLLSMLEKLNRQKLDQLKQDYEQGIYERGIQQDDAKFSEKQRVFQSGQDLLGARSGYLKTKGLGVKAQQLDKEVAIASQASSYESSVREIDKLVEAKEIAIEKAQQLKADLEQINQIKLEDIRAQFDPWNQVLVDTQQGFQGFISTFLSGSQSIGDAAKNMLSSITNTLANLASQWAASEIFSAIFGMGKGASKSSEGGIWDAIMGGNPEFAIADTALKIFGFKDGGVVGDIDHSDYRKGNTPIALALQREGSRSVLAALTPGEMVLNLEQTRRYHELGVDRVLNFREGGVVPGGSTPSFTQSSSGGESININIPVQINSSGGDSRDLAKNAAGLGQALRAVVIQEIQNQKRSGGLLQGV